MVEGAEVQALIDDIRALVEDLKHLGVDEFEVVPGGAFRARRPERGGKERPGRPLRADTRSRESGRPGSGRPGSGRVWLGPREVPKVDEWLASLSGGRPSGEEAGSSAPPGEEPGVTPASVEGLARMVRACRRCARARERVQAVPGSGDPCADLMLIGWEPDESEEAAGVPFQGDVGKRLDRILSGVLGLDRSRVYLTHVLKCRSRGAGLQQQEIRACAGHLEAELNAVRPKVVVALGQAAASYLLRSRAPLDTLRGRRYALSRGGIEFTAYVTLHPGELQDEDRESKRKVWEDMVRVKRKLDLSKAAGGAGRSNLDTK